MDTWFGEHGGRRPLVYPWRLARWKGPNVSWKSLFVMSADVVVGGGLLLKQQGYDSRPYS